MRSLVVGKLTAFFTLRFCNLTRRPTLYFAKSMITSYRSATPWRKDTSGCGFFMNPPSVRITHIGSRESSCHLYERVTEALRMRKRYLRRSTCITGHGLPFTSRMSPNRPDWSLSAHSFDPSVARIASVTVSGTSYLSFGIGSDRSRSSTSQYCAASPMYAFGPVCMTPWSWYQSVRESWLFGYL